MAAPFYASRETIAAAADVRTSAYLDGTLDRLAAQVSRDIERQLNRRFYPLVATRTFDWPLRGSVWLPDDLLAASTVSLDGTAVTGYELDDAFIGAPYDRVDFDDATLTSGDEVTIAGTWGYSQDTVPAGTLATALSDTTGTTVVVSDGSKVGVGDLIAIGSERMVVSGKASTDTGTTLAADVAALTGTTTVAVADGTAVNVGETILVDAERMRVVDVAGNNLTVRRAVDGSVLASHSSGATVYAYRTLTVERGSAGTTAATHSLSAAVTRNLPPGLIVELCIAQVQAHLTGEQSGQASTTGTGESARALTGPSLPELWMRARRYYRRNRVGEAV